MNRIYMLHGFMGTSQTHFSNQIDFFEQNYELILLDLPGHGNSALYATDDFIEDSIEYLINVFKKNGEGYIIGLSLGASIAIHTAFREPNLVKGIIITGYLPFIPEATRKIAEDQYDYYLNIKENDKETASYFNKLHGDKWFNTFKKVHNTMTFNYPILTEEDIRSIQTPMLLINGSNDLNEVEAVSYIKKHNNEINIGLIPDAGHLANIEHPDVFNSLATNFIEKLSKQHKTKI